jgi:hypothetical protein
MKVEKIQTLHPQPGKTNKSIARDKYEYIKRHLMAVLKDGDYSHTELMERLYARVKDEFEGGVQWYGETVKLDLEARGLVERVGRNPERYRLVAKAGQ